jgi:hypothetical protein
LRAFSTLAQLSPSPCHALQVALHISFFFYSFYPLLLAVSSLRSVLLRAVHIVPLLSRSIVYFVCVCSLIAVQQLHCVCFALFAAVALLFFSKVKE